MNAARGKVKLTSWGQKALGKKHCGRKSSMKLNILKGKCSKKMNIVWEEKLLENEHFQKK